MEKQRRYKTFGIIALVLALFGLTIAFATLSSTLTINGTANVESNSWQIKFKSDNTVPTPTVSPVTTTGASANNTISVSQDGLTLTYAANLKVPGDVVTYTAVIRNYGSLDGQISTNGVVNTLVSGNSTKAARILDIKTYYTSDGKELTSGDIIKANTEEEITIRVRYDKENVLNSDLSNSDETYVYQYTINYVQATTNAQSNTHNGSVLVAPVVTYSFQLGSLASLNYTNEDNTLIFDSTSFWSAVGTDLTLNSDYYADVGKGNNAFTLSSSSSSIITLSASDFIDDIDPSHGTADYMVFLYDDGENAYIEVSYWDESKSGWSTYDFGTGSNMSAATFLSTYGSVTFTFQEISN